MYNTASGRFYQPGETFMTHLTYSGLCFFFFFFQKSTERIDERNIKVPIATSKCRPTTSEVAWVFFLGDNAAVPPAYWVKVQKCASFVDILDVCKFTTFCDRNGYTAGRSISIIATNPSMFE